MNRALTAADARVFRALCTVPDSAPIEVVAEVAGVTYDELRKSMMRLALRHPGQDPMVPAN